MITTDAALQRVKGIKKSFDNGVKNNLEQYMENRVINFYRTSEISEIFTSTESMSGIKELSEQEAPPVLTLEDGYSVTITEKRFGGAISLSEAIYKREGKDTTLKVDSFLKRQRNKIMKASVKKLLTDAFLMLNEAFDSTSDYLAPDGVELCGSHTWASGGTFDNGVTAALDEAAVDTAFEYAGAFTDPAGIETPLNFDTIVVKKGSAAEREARRLFAEHIAPTAIGDINLYEGSMTIISTPFITTTNKAYWFMLDSSEETALAVGIGQYPMMNDPIVQNNQSILSNVTDFRKQGIINMPYMFYGSDGTT